MSHRVPNIDAHLSQVGDVHRCRSPSSGKGEVASDFFWGQKGLDYSGDRKRTDACIFSLDGMASHVPWMATVDSEEKGANVFEMSRESALATDVSLGHIPFQEDEMLSWLQYPLDDSFNKSYCSEQQCEQTFTPFAASSERPLASDFSAQLVEKTNSTTGVRPFTKDAAMVLGARRAAGLVAQAGAEVFDRVHTIRQTCNEASSSKSTDTVLPPSNREVSSSTLELAGRHNIMNFPFFSQRVAAMKSSFQVLGNSRGPSMKEQPIMMQTEEILSSVEQSTAAPSLTSLSPFREESDLNEQNQGTDTSIQRSVDPLICHKKVGQAEVEHNTHNAAIGTELLETGDLTLTSLSGGSDYSTDKSAKDVSCKRKSCSVEEFECESKNTGGVALQGTGSAMARASSVKRTRAAEIHNQSERRRRNKINQKMQALQELIPNANKTDKASMLDEAIEYVKMLQAQLQLMSTRTGMIVPPVMMPPGMQYLSLQQGPNSPHMHMARGSSRGVGSGVIDASTSGIGARPVFLGQPFSGHVYHHMTAYPPYASPSVVRDMQSHLHRGAMHKMPASQQLQPAHLQRTASIHKVDADSRKRHQNEPQ